MKRAPASAVLMFYLLSFLTIGLLLTGCFPANINQTGRDRETTPQANSTTQPVSSSLYLLLSSKSPPITYTIAHMPFSCLLANTPCQDFESAPAFPNYPFVPGSVTPFHWSLDASYFLLYNGYDSALLFVDANTLEARKISIPFSVISDDLPWSPNGDWIAVSTQDISSPYISHIIMVDPLTSNYDFRDLPASLNGTLFPLAWVSENELLIYQGKYDDTGESNDQKKDVIEWNLVKLDLMDLSYEIVMNLNPRGDGLPRISPDGTAFIVSSVVGQQAVLEVYTIEGARLQSFCPYLNAAWSPDSAHIAAFLQEEDGFSVFMLDPESGEQRKLFHLSEQPELTWFPDGDGLLIRTRITDEQGQDRTPLYLVSLAGEVQEVAIDKVINQDLLVVGNSLRPTGSQ